MPYRFMAGTDQRWLKRKRARPATHASDGTPYVVNRKTGQIRRVTTSRK